MSTHERISTLCLVPTLKKIMKRSNIYEFHFTLSPIKGWRAGRPHHAATARTSCSRHQWKWKGSFILFMIQTPTRSMQPFGLLPLRKSSPAISRGKRKKSHCLHSGLLHLNIEKLQQEKNAVSFIHHYVSVLEVLLLAGYCCAQIKQAFLLR